MRIETACSKLKTAVYGGPVETSNAFRYLRKIGIQETKLALNQFDSTAHSSVDEFVRKEVFLHDNLPFLFEPVDCLRPSHAMTYSRGIVFNCNLNGHRDYEINVSKIVDANLAFTTRTFIPDNDLWRACKQAISQFQSQLDETNSDPAARNLTEIEDVEYWVFFWLSASVRHLRPGYEHTVVLKEFLQENDFEWNWKNERYELRLNADRPFQDCQIAGGDDRCCR